MQWRAVTRWIVSTMEIADVEDIVTSVFAGST